MVEPRIFGFTYTYDGKTYHGVRCVFSDGYVVEYAHILSARVAKHEATLAHHDWLRRRVAEQDAPATAQPCKELV